MEPLLDQDGVAHLLVDRVVDDLGAGDASAARFPDSCWRKSGVSATGGYGCMRRVRPGSPWFTSRSLMRR